MPETLDPRAHHKVPTLIIRASRFTDERARVPNAFTGSPLQLIGRQHSVRVTKKGTPAFSPTVYKEGASRGKRGVEWVTAVVLDFDHVAGDAALEVDQALRGLAHITYSSYSHGADGPDDNCFRVMLFCSRPMTPDEYGPVWEFANHLLGDYADRQAADLSRIWYLPSCPPERREYAKFRSGDGKVLDVDAILDRNPPRDPKRPGKAGGRVSPPDLDRSGPVPEGERNNFLTRLAGGMRRQGLPYEAILVALCQVNTSRCQPPLEESDVQRIARSVSEYDPASPLILLHRTDAGNAERLVAHAGKDLWFIYVWDDWLYWDGTSWVRDNCGQVMRYALDTVRTTAAFAASMPEKEPRERLFKHAIRTESAGRLAAMVSLARPLLHLRHDILDTHPFLFNVENGTIDLQKNALLREHLRSDLLTKRSPVPFVPAARCPTWEAFLYRVMDGNEDLVRFLQRAVGYSLTASTREQVLFLLYGSGANGKSTFMEVLRLILGDYAMQAEFSTFLKQDSEAVRNDIARLVGARLVAAVETESGLPLAEALVKQMTGGDVVTARFLFKEYFEFRPTFKVWLAANHKPVIRGTDHGIWRRIRLIPFIVTIPENERDPDLGEKLKAELPGILAWAVKGCLDWQEQGLGVPEKVRSATAAFRDEMDVLGGFLTDLCAVEADATGKSAELYAAYKKWAEENGERVMSQKSLAMRLVERGFEPCKGALGARCWRGLRLRVGGSA